MILKVYIFFDNIGIRILFNIYYLYFFGEKYD